MADTVFASISAVNSDCMKIDGLQRKQNAVLLKTQTKESVNSVLRRIYLIAAGLSFLTGTAIYILYRNANLLIWKFFLREDFWDRFAINVDLKEGILLPLFVYHGSDGLWLLSGILLIRAIWLVQEKIALLYITAFCLVAVFFEICQLLKIVPGTFDILDILTYLGVASVECIFFHLFIIRRIKA